MSDNETIRDMILGRDFSAWQGLPADCSADDLFDLPNIAERPTRPLGEERELAEFLVLELEGYYRPMVNFRDNQLIMFDAMNPELADGWESLAEYLGTPEAEWDWTYGSVDMPGGEWVYPKKGITVFLNRKRTKALHIALYVPTTLEAYRDNLRPFLKKTYRPSKKY